MWLLCYMMTVLSMVAFTLDDGGVLDEGFCVGVRVRFCNMAALVGDGLCG